MAKLQIQMEVERATKNTVRYAEKSASLVNENGAQAAFGAVLSTLYIQKWAIQQLLGGKDGAPTTITVTIE